MAPSPSGRMALHYACYYGQTDCAKYLIKMGSLVSRTDVDGNTPLHCAAMKGFFFFIIFNFKLLLLITNIYN